VPAPPANPADAARGASPADLQELARRQLLLPVAGVRRESLVDTYQDDRSGGRVHHALDIPAPRSTPVLAVEDGTVAKLFTSKLGGLTVYEFDPTQSYSYYYAHLDRYAEGLKEGDRLRKGQVVGYVGSTGDASPEAPHLHFEIVRLNPDRHWWQGTPIDPFLVFRSGAATSSALGR
jgi:murein DD-endopeptidase MepM/ murein hydrolase activator NlpD